MCVCLIVKVCVLYLVVFCFVRYWFHREIHKNVLTYFIRYIHYEFRFFSFGCSWMEYNHVEVLVFIVSIIVSCRKQTRMWHNHNSSVYNKNIWNVISNCCKYSLKTFIKKRRKKNQNRVGDGKIRFWDGTNEFVIISMLNRKCLRLWLSQFIQHFWLTIIFHNACSCWFDYCRLR